MTVPFPQAPPPASNGRRKKPLLPWLAAAAVICVLAVIALVAVNAVSDRARDRLREKIAIEVCQTFVQQELPNPSTAVISDAVADRKGSGWIVHGSVDSQKCVGAVLRRQRDYFECPVRELGDDSWQAGRVRMGDTP